MDLAGATVPYIANHLKTDKKFEKKLFANQGCGVLVLKRLADAVRDNDRIYGQILGYGEAQEGPSSSIGTPTVGVEALAMEIALKDGNTQPHEVSYVECHGTGTQVGFKEIKSVNVSRFNSYFPIGWGSTRVSGRSSSLLQPKPGSPTGNWLRKTERGPHRILCRNHRNYKNCAGSGSRGYSPTCGLH